MTTAIIVAAGKGERVGLETPKQFIEIDGKQILSLSIEAFKKNKEINQIIIVVNEKWHNKISNLYSDCKVIIGGASRQESVKIGVESCDNHAEIVLIHDAARPFISQNIIQNCIKKIKSADAVAPILDSTDSLVEINGNKHKLINRRDIKSVQTPQCFKINVIKKAMDTKFTSTDEIGLLLKKNPNSNLVFIKGSSKNFKITSKYDLLLAKCLMKNK